VAQDIILEAGGSGNFLILASRLGLKVRAFGAVGDDLYGAQVLKLLTGEGINIENIAVPAGSRTTTVMILVDEQAQHVFVGMYGTGQSLTFQPEWTEMLRQAGALFTSGYALHPTSAFSPAMLLACLDIAHEQQVPIFFDLGPAAFEVDRADVNAAIIRTTMLLATLDEAAAWIGASDPLDTARQFLSQGPAIVVIKLGAQGCLIVTPERQISLDAFPIQVRDTAGAGDAFAAACVYGYLQGFSLEQMGLLANAVGAATAARLGTGTHLPRKQEIVRLLQQYGYTFL
jgi:sugar/nucleoside kinase (ribokinase family)